MRAAARWPPRPRGRSAAGCASSPAGCRTRPGNAGPCPSRPFPCLTIVHATVDMSIVASYIAQAIVYSSIVAEATRRRIAVSPPTPTTSQSPGRLARLADFAFRRRRIVLAAWIAAFVVALGAASQLGGDYHADYSTPGSESKAAEQRLADRFPQQTPFTVDVVWQAKDASSAAVTKRIDPLLRQAQKLPGIGGGVTARDADVSRDGTIAVARLPLSVSNVDNVPKATGEKLIKLAQATDSGGLRVELAGQPIEQAQQGAISSEGIGMAIA